MQDQIDSDVKARKAHSPGHQDWNPAGVQQRWLIRAGNEDFRDVNKRHHSACCRHPQGAGIVSSQAARTLAAATSQTRARSRVARLMRATMRCWRSALRTMTLRTMRMCQVRSSPQNI